MFPREHGPVDEKENQSRQTEANSEWTHSTTRPESPQEVHATEVINIQPLPQEGPGPQTSTCPQCGLTAPDPGLLSVDQSRLQFVSSLSVHSSSSNKKKKKRTKTNQPAATPGDSCFHLLLACLSCQCSVILTGLLFSCSFCLHTFCSSCCHACTRCCAAIQETPVEEINCNAHCHSVMFDSCCEPTECLEFCLDCCDICHRS